MNILCFVFDSLQCDVALLGGDDMVACRNCKVKGVASEFFIHLPIGPISQSAQIKYL